MMTTFFNDRRLISTTIFLQLKNSICLGMLFFICACGNPHLISKNSSSSLPQRAADTTTTPQVSTKPAPTIGEEKPVPTSDKDVDLYWSYGGLVETKSGDNAVGFGKSSYQSEIKVSVNVVNIGKAIVSLKDGSISGSDKDFFHIIDNNHCLTITLDPRASCQFFISFKNSSVNLDDSSAYGIKSALFRATYFGIAKADKIFVEEKNLLGEKSKDIPPGFETSVYNVNGIIDFGKVELGNASTKLIEITTTSATADIIQQIEQAIIVDDSLDSSNQEASQIFKFSGPSAQYPGARPTATCSPDKIFVGKSHCFVEVTYRPTTVGKNSAGLRFIINGRSFPIVTLKGEGISNTGSNNCKEKHEVIIGTIAGSFNTPSKVDNYSFMRPRVVLPYKQHSSVTSRTLSLRHGLETSDPTKKYSFNFCDLITGLHCTDIQRNQVDGVKDTMIFARFSVIPELADQEKLVDARFQLNIKKVANTITGNTNFLETEMVCVQGLKKRACSGTTFNNSQEASWFKLINPAFFNAQYPLASISRIFTDLFLSEPQGNPSHIEKITLGKEPNTITVTKLNLIKTLSVKELFNFSTPDLVDLFYNPYSASKNDRSFSFNIILADDIFFAALPTLILDVEKPIACKE